MASIGISKHISLESKLRINVRIPCFCMKYGKYFIRDWHISSLSFECYHLCRICLRGKELSIALVGCEEEVNHFH